MDPATTVGKDFGCSDRFFLVRARSLGFCQDWLYAPGNREPDVFSLSVVLSPGSLA